MKWRIFNLCCLTILALMFLDCRHTIEKKNPKNVSTSTDDSPTNGGGSGGSGNSERSVIRYITINYHNNDLLIDPLNTEKPILNNAAVSSHTHSYQAFNNEGIKLSYNYSSKKGYRFSGWKDTNDKIWTINDYVYDEGTYNFDSVWNTDTEHYWSAQQVDFSDSSDLSIDFVSIPGEINAIMCKDANMANEITINNPYGFSICTHDLTGKELCEIMKMNNDHNLGFETLNVANVYDTNILEGYAHEQTNPNIYTNGIKLVKKSGNKYFANNIVDSASKSDYPVTHITLPQAIIVCNMLTAIYNLSHEDKLTYAYSLSPSTSEPTDDVGSSYVIKNIDDAVEFISASKNTNLSNPETTGFRLLRAYEYNIASRIVPEVSPEQIQMCYNNDLPAYVLSSYYTSAAVGKDEQVSDYVNYFDQNKLATVSSIYGKTNAIGLYNCTGNVRKWLETKLNNEKGNKDYAVRSGSFVKELDECAVGKYYDGRQQNENYDGSCLPYDSVYYDLGVRIGRTLK